MNRLGFTLVILDLSQEVCLSIDSVLNFAPEINYQIMYLLASCERGHTSQIRAMHLLLR